MQPAHTLSLSLAIKQERLKWHANSKNPDEAQYKLSAPERSMHADQENIQIPASNKDAQFQIHSSNILKTTSTASRKQQVQHHNRPLISMDKSVNMSWFYLINHAT